MSSSSSAAAPTLSAPLPKVGDTFASTKELRVGCERALLSQSRTLVSDFRKGGSHAKLFRCAGAVIVKGQQSTGGCQVLIRANKRQDKHWYITETQFEHSNCAGGKKKPSVAALAKEGEVVVNANRKITAGGLVKTLKGTHGVELTQHAANRVKRHVVGVSEEAQNEGYQRLESFLDLLAEGSPGTVTHVEFDAQGHFVRCFFMLGGVANFACAGVQQVACMDFAHCKGDWNGTIGAISTKSSNNNIVHLATCIVAKETGDAYRYLIDNALKNPSVAAFVNKPSTTIITDKHKGSESAVPDRLDQAEHLRCGEHLLKNCGTVGPDGRMHFYQAARAPDKATCEHHLNKIKDLNSAAYEKLAAAPRDKWAMYATRGNVVWDQVNSNMAESLNSAMGSETRQKPVFDTVQDIVMQSASKLAAAAGLKELDLTATFTPFVMKAFNAEMEWAKACDVSPTGNGGYMVFPNNSRRHYNVVALVFDKDNSGSHEFSCTCGFCQRWLIPCRHVIAVAKANDQHPKLLELLDDGYRLEKFRAAASDPRFRIVPPVWTSLTVRTEHKAPLPVQGQAGRKKGVRPTKRKASTGEFNTSSRAYANHIAASNSQANAAWDLSQGLSQGAGAGAGGP